MEYGYSGASNCDPARRSTTSRRFGRVGNLMMAYDTDDLRLDEVEPL